MALIRFLKTLFGGEADNQPAIELLAPVPEIVAATPMPQEPERDVLALLQSGAILKGRRLKYPYPPMPVIDKSVPISTAYGSASWDNELTLVQEYTQHGEYEIDGEGFYIGAHKKILTPMHGVCIAGSGQGKGTCIILPNLLSVPGQSWFVLDPKGENALITAGFQSKHNRVVLLDPWDEQQRLGATHQLTASGFNPLAFVRSIPDELADNCAVIADMLVIDSPDVKDPYWNSRARTLIKAYLLHIVTTCPLEEQNLGTLYKWLRLSVIERPKLWAEMVSNDACDGAIQDGINQFFGMSETNGPLGSIISNAQDNTEFLQSMALRRSLAKDEFDPYELTNGKTTVYLCLPERFLRTHARWLRLVVGVCLKACNYRPNKRVNFLLDEFAILGKMPDVETAYAFGRGQKIFVYIFVQTLEQLIRIYGKHGANEFLSNARLRQFFGIYDLDTQKYLSEYLGEQTIEVANRSISNSKSSEKRQIYSDTEPFKPTGEWVEVDTSKSISNTTSYQLLSRKLLTSEEVGKSNTIITLIDGYKFQIGKLPFWESMQDKYKQGLLMYVPKDLEDWRDFIDTMILPPSFVVKDNHRLMIKDLFLKRSHGTVIKNPKSNK